MELNLEIERALQNIVGKKYNELTDYEKELVGEPYVVTDAYPSDPFKLEDVEDGDNVLIDFSNSLFSCHATLNRVYLEDVEIYPFIEEPLEDENGTYFIDIVYHEIYDTDDRAIINKGFEMLKTLDGKSVSLDDLYKIEKFKCVDECEYVEDEDYNVLSAKLVLSEYNHLNGDKTITIYVK